MPVKLGVNSVSFTQQNGTICLACEKPISLAFWFSCRSSHGQSGL